MITIRGKKESGKKLIASIFLQRFVTTHPLAPQMQLQHQLLLHLTQSLVSRGLHENT
jgi:hypothetical protein